MSEPERRIPISIPSIGDEEWQSLRGPIESGWLTQGPKVSEFERNFAARHAARHAIATTSCTTGLHLALVALGVGPGDEVIVPAFTWVSTANVVLYCGATPVLADVDPHTFNVDPRDVANRITKRTKVVIAVHLFGLCADLDELRTLIPAGIPIVEDCACAAGATYKGRPAGTLGVAGVFSFHPRKSITTGEGGMITTDDDELAEKMDQLRNHGAAVSEETRHRGPQPWQLPDFNLLGFNYRMTDLQGAVGVVQLGKLDSFLAGRDEMANHYLVQLADIPWLRLPSHRTGDQHAWQSFVTLVDPDTAPAPRNELMRQLAERGVATRPGTHAVHMLAYYEKRFGFRPDDYPGARAANDHSMAIPLHNRMSMDDCDYVVSCLKQL